MSAPPPIHGRGGKLHLYRPRSRFARLQLQQLACAVYAFRRKRLIKPEAIFVGTPASIFLAQTRRRFDCAALLQRLAQGLGEANVLGRGPLPQLARFGDDREQPGAELAAVVAEAGGER